MFLPDEVVIRALAPALLPELLHLETKLSIRAALALKHHPILRIVGPIISTRLSVDCNIQLINLTKSTHS